MYDLAVFLGFLVYLPKILYRKITQKGYQYPFWEKLGFNLPKIDSSVYFFHANSLGETKAGITFAEFIKNKKPDITIVFSSVTETGKEEAEKSDVVDYSIYMPLDFSFAIKRLYKKIKPKAIFVVETDFWYHFLSKAPCPVHLISGKVSARSLNRYKRFSFLSRKLFSNIQTFCLQNTEYEKAFIDLGVDKKQIFVTGNIKFDQKPVEKDPKELIERLLLQKQDKILTIASTHDDEEIKLIKILLDHFDKILLAPRHPQRFDKVYQELIKEKIPVSRYSKDKSLSKKVILIDAMGLVPTLYKLSQVAIVGGSFIQSVGGHNVLEPLVYNTPVLFGPYMYGQKDLTDYALKTDLALQTTYKSLLEDITKLTTQSKATSINFSQVSEKIWEKINKGLQENKPLV